MKQTKLKIYKHGGFLLLTILLIITTFITLMIHLNKDFTNANFLITWAIENQLSILIFLIVISVAFGFGWSNISYREIKKTKMSSKSLLDTILLFLSGEEKEIVNLLVKQKGTTTQVEISRLAGMNRVKAYRSLQKMQEKNLVDITSHGKIRKVVLKASILNILLDEGK